MERITLSLNQFHFKAFHCFELHCSWYRILAKCTDLDHGFWIQMSLNHTKKEILLLNKITSQWIMSHIESQLRQRFFQWKMEMKWLKFYPTLALKYGSFHCVNEHFFSWYTKRMTAVECKKKRENKFSFILCIIYFYYIIQHTNFTH